jgi:hypothetical protein
MGVKTTTNAASKKTIVEGSRQVVYNVAGAIKLKDQLLPPIEKSIEITMKTFILGANSTYVLNTRQLPVQQSDAATIFGINLKLSTLLFLHFLQTKIFWKKLISFKWRKNGIFLLG